MKWVHMGNNKSFVDCELLYHLYLLSIHPYGVDKAYYALAEVECKLLMNIIFLMDGVFRCRTHLIVHLYESGSGATSYENVDIFSRALMNIQTRCMTY